MHQSVKEIIVLKAQNELLQTNFQESLAAAPLLTSDELIMLSFNSHFFYGKLTCTVKAYFGF
jgi:hypothetical protein